MPAGIPMQVETIRKHSTWFMIYGIVVILIGAVAIVAPGFAAIATGITVGWLLIVSGVLGVIAVFSAGKPAPGFWWNLLTAVLYLLAGIALLRYPVVGAVTLTIILTVYLLATGFAKVAIAISYRKNIPGAWGWMLFSALFDISLGLMIVMGLPLTGVWILGLLVGINLLFTGIGLLVAALRSRKLAVAGATARPA